MSASRLRLLTVCIAAIILSGCSSTTDFVIINESDAEIEVKYQLKAGDPNYKETLREVPFPGVLPLQDFKSRKPWQQLTEPGKQFVYDEATKVFAYRLASGMVLRIDTALNYYGSEGQFHVSKITITGPNGSIDLNGRQAQVAFREVDNSDLGIAYK